MKTMGDRLRQARKDAGFTAARQAAIKHRWSPSTYAAHENGQNEFDPETAAIYAKAFKVTAGWLLTGDDAPAARGQSEALTEVYGRLRELRPEQQAVIAGMIEIILRGLNAGDFGRRPGTGDNSHTETDGPMRVMQALVQRCQYLRLQRRQKLPRLDFPADLANDAMR